MVCNRLIRLVSFAPTAIVLQKSGADGGCFYFVLMKQVDICAQVFGLSVKFA